MFCALLRTRLAGMFSHLFRGSKNSKKHGIGFKILIALLVVYVLGCFSMLFGMMFYAICQPYKELGLTWLYFSMAAVMATVLAFVGSIFMTQAQLYDARDNELLLSMPVKPSAILASRMIALYVINLVFESLVMLPAGVVYAMQEGVNPLGAVFFAVLLLVLPFFALSLSSVIGFVIALIGSRLRNKSLITMVLSVAFLIVYFIVISRMDEYLGMLITGGGEIAAKIKDALPFLYYFGAAVSDGDAVSLLASVGIIAVIFLAVYLVLSLTFVKIATSKRGTVKVKYREKELKVSNVKAALTRKELTRFFKSPIYILNGSMGVVLLLIGCVLLIVKSDFIGMVSEMMPEFEGMIALAGMAVICFINTMNLVSAPSISLDGKTLWISQSMPAEAGDVLDAKAKMHLVITQPATIIASVIVIIIARPGITHALLTLLLPFVLNFFIAYSGVFINLHMPKFDWINETAAIKQSGSVMVSMLVNFAVLLVGALLYFLLLNKVMGIEVYLFAFTAILAALTYIFYRYLYTKGADIYMSF